MALEEVINASEISSDILWPLVQKALSPIITLVKVVGVVLLIYIIYLLIRGILTYRRNRKIDIMYEKVLEIDRKLNELLKKSAKKEKIIEKKGKKTGFFARLFEKNKKGK